MKRLTLLIAMFFCFQAFSQNSKSGTAAVNAVVVDPIGISTGDSTLDFGTFTTSENAATVTVLADGSARNFSEGDMELIGETTFSPASFTVTMDNSQTYSISLTTTKDPALSDDSDSMSISSLSHNGSASGNTASSFKVGGVLAVPADQTAGTYTGEIQVTVSYE